MFASFNILAIVTVPIPLSYKLNIFFTYSLAIGSIINLPLLLASFRYPNLAVPPYM